MILCEYLAPLIQRGMPKNINGVSSGNLKSLAIGLAILFFIMLIWPFAIIDAGERGVVTRLGAYSRTILPGFHVVVPLLEQVTKFEVRTQKEQAEASAASKDLQTVNATVAVNYNIDPEKSGRFVRDYRH